MLAIDVLQIGAVFTEADLGSDLHGDTFEITFEGGAPETELTRIVIDGDQDEPGFGEGDVFFDHAAGGFGADEALPFTVVVLETADPNASVRASVQDGQTNITLDLVGFRAGDRLIFSIDVDEVEDFDPGETDPVLINDGFDPITSGVEFQGSKLIAEFIAPHYFDASGSGEFRNRYDDALDASGLDLPADNASGQRDRTDGVMFPVTQAPLPVAISGSVYLDNDLDLVKQSGDAPLSDVELALWMEEGASGSYQFTGHTATTNSNGEYEFGLELGLSPGVYQVREMQPTGLFSVGAVPGTIAGNMVGSAADPDRLTGIALLDGGPVAIDYDFAEALPAAISGFVFHDQSNDGVRSFNGNEEGIAGVIVEVVPISTISAQTTIRLQTDAAGFYSADGLAPGDYRVVEVAQPPRFFDGLDREGTVDGARRGSASNPGDQIDDIRLFGGDVGIEYNFGEISPASLSGRVHLSSAEGDCFGDEPVLPPLEGVTVQLLNDAGQLLSEATTDINGEYRFDQLLPGEYTLVELTPSGLLDGDEHAGTIGGRATGVVVGNDQIAGILIQSGDEGLRYDFCEHEPAAVSGFVYHDQSNEGVFDATEDAIAGVEVELLDATDQVIAAQTTDASGFYRFEQLPAGNYALREAQPAGWVDGLDSAGTVAGVTVGIASNPGDSIRDVQLGYGEQGVHYNFGELAPVKIGGFVFHDRNNDGIRDPGEEGLAGVRVTVSPLETFAPQDPVILTTSADGMYMTGMLSPGRYEIVEDMQPAGYFDGLDTPGQISGESRGVAINPGDRLTEIEMSSGEVGTNYNFGELLPSSIRGRVHLSDSDGDCFNDTIIHQPLGGVELALQNERGETIARTLTNDDGEYQFVGLAPGTYTVVETTPDGVLDGGERAGKIDGVVVGEVTGNDTIGSIVLLAGQSAVDFDFCEHAPASVSGFVYHDSNNSGELDINEAPIGGVTINLLDASGRVLGARQTNDDGYYEFKNLLAGDYSLRELQPDGWYDGLDSAGTIGSAVVGAAINPGDRINGIRLGSGDQGVQYNFGELAPVKIGGFVYHDRDNDGNRDPGEEGLAGVTLTVSPLLTFAPQDSVTLTTSADGMYMTGMLSPGRYEIVEDHQPAGFFDGLDTAGQVDSLPRGVALNPGDRITQIDLSSGQIGVEFNFGELAPASISGFIHSDPNENCVVDAGETPIADVKVELLDAAGQLVASTRSDGDGRYHFGDLLPGEYSVREFQPEGFFQGSQRAGSHGAQEISEDRITVDLASGDQLTEYNFCEVPHAQLSGFVFQDGPTILTPNGQLQQAVGELRDGVRSADDTPIGGVVLQLRNGLDGIPIDAADALPGYYEPGPISVITGPDGSYLFSGIRGNSSYAVYQVHPADFIDGIDTAGSTSGFAVNLGEFDSNPILERYAGIPGDDAIVLIPLRAGDSSTENNFSEVLVEAVRSPVPPAERPAVPVVAREVFIPPLAAARGVQLASIRPAAEIPLYGGGSSYTWHLSVVDGGMPRGVDSAETVNVMIWRQATYLDVTHWQGENLRQARWTLKLDGDATVGDAEGDMLSLSFGIAGGTPVAGDFNGDGVEEIGVFFEGEWFVDLNGNGRWDEEDLWALLGSKEDRPVTGDWDGDGKDDIGIFGPSWSNDEQAIRAEPGLPDVLNVARTKPKNPPPQPEEAAEGRRLLRLHADGLRRADVIDHVFRFGASRDIPVAADLDGDGIASIGTFRDGQWKLDVNGDGRFDKLDREASFGEAGDVPVVGDFNGDGVDEIGVYRAGTWHIDANRNFELDAHDRVFEMGEGPDQPVVGDWDGDGADEPGVYREGGGGDPRNSAS